MKVLGSKLLLKVKKEDGCVQKVGGLTIPCSAGSDYESAEVLEIGDEISSPNISKGDNVYIYPGSGKVIFNQGVEYRVITINDIIVVL